MTREEFKDILIEFYPKFYIQVTGNRRYKFKPTNSRLLQIEKFVEYVDEKIDLKLIGEDFLKRYYRFAFGRVTNKSNQYGAKNAFPLNWIIAKSVLDKFTESSANEKFKKSYRLLKQGHSTKEIKSSKTIELEKQDKIRFVLELKPHEENEKARFHNTNKGKFWCIDFTTLYNPKSNYCVDCKFKTECLSLLKKHYPKIFVIRQDEGKV